MSASFPIPQAPTSTQSELELDVATPGGGRRRGPTADELLDGGCWGAPEPAPARPGC
jgi:hypothetical protein